jgi:hypothetical protein
MKPIKSAASETIAFEVAEAQSVPSVLPKHFNRFEFMLPVRSEAAKSCERQKANCHSQVPR